MSMCLAISPPKLLDQMHSLIVLRKITLIDFQKIHSIEKDPSDIVRTSCILFRYIKTEEGIECSSSSSKILHPTDLGTF